MRREASVTIVPDRGACLNALAAVAPLLNDLKASPDAAPLYDLMSGGLLWTDEFPDFRALRKIPGWGVVRLLFRFRTTLILGEPDAELRFCWEAGQALFPGWPAFDPGRCTPELRPIALRLTAESDAWLDHDLKASEAAEARSSTLDLS